MKASILLLCNVLNKIQNESLLSIHFINGKRNLCKDNGVQVFWNVIHNLICSCVGCDDIHKCVKINIGKRGYHGLIFYALPSDGSGGIRELLLALSWLIGKGIIEEKMDNLVKESMCVQEFLDSEIEVSKSNEDARALSKTDWCKHVLHKAGHVQFLYRKLADTYSERSRLLQMLHEEYKNVVGIPLLSVLQATIICYPNELLHQYVEYIKLFNSLLESYLLWKTKEKIYFDWIETVLEEKIEKKYTLLDDEMIWSAKDFKSSLVEVIKQSILSNEEVVLQNFEDLEKNEDFERSLKCFRSILKSMNLRVIRRK